jgi:hypothetical protein
VKLDRVTESLGLSVFRLGRQKVRWFGDVEADDPQPVRLTNAGKSAREELTKHQPHVAWQ